MGTFGVKKWFAAACFLVALAAGVAGVFLVLASQQPPVADPGGDPVQVQSADAKSSESRTLVGGQADTRSPTDMPSHERGQASPDRGRLGKGSEVEEPPSFLDRFQRRFLELSNAHNWEALDEHITKSLRDAESLQELLPLLVSLLETLDSEVGYDPIGRSVQLGLFPRRDLTDCADMLTDIFLDTDSHVVRVGLAGPLSQATKGKPTVTLKLHVEDLLIHRRQYMDRLGPIERSAHWDQLIAAHVGFSRSILDSIRFVESLRPGGLSDARVRSFWTNQCASAFYYNQYDSADVAEITDYLITHTDESIGSTVADERQIRRLKKIWQYFRETHAYETALEHASNLTEGHVQEAYDQILAHCLAENGSEDGQSGEGD